MFSYKMRTAKQKDIPLNEFWRKQLDTDLLEDGWKKAIVNKQVEVYTRLARPRKTKKDPHSLHAFINVEVEEGADLFLLNITSDSSSPLEDIPLIMTCMFIEEKVHMLQDVIKSAQMQQMDEVRKERNKKIVIGVCEGILIGAAIAATAGAGAVVLGAVGTGGAAVAGTGAAVAATGAGASAAAIAAGEAAAIAGVVSTTAAGVAAGTTGVAATASALSTVGVATTAVGTAAGAAAAGSGAGAVATAALTVGAAAAINSTATAASGVIISLAFSGWSANKLKISMPKVITTLGERNVIYIASDKTIDEIAYLLKVLDKPEEVDISSTGKLKVKNPDWIGLHKQIKMSTKFVKSKAGDLLVILEPDSKLGLSNVYLRIQDPKDTGIIKVEAWRRELHDNKAREKAMGETIFKNETKVFQAMSGEMYLILVLKDLSERLGQHRQALEAYLSIARNNPKLASKLQPMKNIDTTQATISDNPYTSDSPEDLEDLM